MSCSEAAIKTYRELRFLDVVEANSYFKIFFEFLTKTKVSFNWPLEDLEKRGKRVVELADAIRLVSELHLPDAERNGKKLTFIGNGGSAGIAMHALADYANAGGFKTADLYNPALLTCMSNDYGYENVFAKPIELLVEPGDMLFAISSSGKSSNIITAAKTAKVHGCYVVTFSGFDADNPLRKIGNLNFYTPSTHYGFVELAHQILIHCILDLFIRHKIYEKEKETLG